MEYRHVSAPASNCFFLFSCYPVLSAILFEHFFSPGSWCDLFPTQWSTVHIKKKSFWRDYFEFTPLVSVTKYSLSKGEHNHRECRDDTLSTMMMTSTCTRKISFRIILFFVPYRSVSINTRKPYHTIKKKSHFFSIRFHSLASNKHLVT